MSCSHRGGGEIVLNVIVEKVQNLMPVSVELIDFSKIFLDSDKSSNHFYISRYCIQDLSTGYELFGVRNDYFIDKTGSNKWQSQLFINYNPNNMGTSNLYTYTERNNKGYLECKQAAKFTYKLILIDLLGTGPSVEFKYMRV